MHLAFKEIKMIRKNELLLSGVSLTSPNHGLRLHLLSNAQGKVQTSNYDIDQYVFERYITRHFSMESCEYVSTWINSATLTSNRWQYLNIKHLGCLIDPERLSGYTSHYELVKDFFKGSIGNVNRLRGAI
ncbi:MAG: hypothetical protein ACI84C_000192 [Flavobacteriales bacterium]|jgi:hypothetical protein